jgi:hypothetical protein
MRMRSLPGKELVLVGTVGVTVLFALFESELLAQAGDAAGGEPVVKTAEKTAAKSGGDAEVFERAEDGPPDFRRYVFWAYSLACVLLFLFVLWTLVQTRGLEERCKYLRERFRRAHPGDDEGP